MKKHLIDITLAAESLTTLFTHITGVEAGIEPIAYTLDDDQRKRLLRMGLRNETFSRAALEVARQNPTLVPATMDIAAIERDLTARDQLMPALFRLRRMTRLLEDTVIACGVDAYNGSRGLYKAMKVVAEINGLGEIVAELGERFARQGRSTEEVPAASETAPTQPAGGTNLAPPLTLSSDHPNGCPFEGTRFSLAVSQKPRNVVSAGRSVSRTAFCVIRSGFFCHEMGLKGESQGLRRTKFGSEPHRTRAERLRDSRFLANRQAPWVTRPGFIRDERV